jgi:hypothetical protein
VRRVLVRWILLPLLFIATCTPLVRPAMKIADSRTNVPLDALDGAFPILIVRERAAHVSFLQGLGAIPPLPPGSSYLVPAHRERAITGGLRAHSLVLRVKRLAADRQQLELYRMDDGYYGGTYEATATAVKPLHRKITGPGFAFLAGGIAILLNAAVWTVTALAVVLFRRARATARRAR